MQSQSSFILCLPGFDSFSAEAVKFRATHRFLVVLTSWFHDTIDSPVFTDSEFTRGSKLDARGESRRDRRPPRLTVAALDLGAVQSRRWRFDRLRRPLSSSEPQDTPGTVRSMECLTSAAQNGGTLKPALHSNTYSSLSFAACTSARRATKDLPLFILRRRLEYSRRARFVCCCCLLVCCLLLFFRRISCI